MGEGVGKIVGSGCELTVAEAVPGEVVVGRRVGLCSEIEKEVGMGLALLQPVNTKLIMQRRKTFRQVPATIWAEPQGVLNFSWCFNYKPRSFKAW